jgi:hypothetical protein
MSITQMSNEQATRTPTAGMVDMKLDVVVHPVSDVDSCQALLPKTWDGGLGADLAGGDNRQRSEGRRLILPCAASPARLQSMGWIKTHKRARFPRSTLAE